MQAAKDELADQLALGINALGLTLPEAAADRLIQYLALLTKWNQVYNLTAIRDPEQMVVLHLLDSLAVAPHLGAAVNLLDVGAGAGLPGIPLAIARPELAVTVLDSNHKKAAFMRQAKLELDLDNLVVECARVEDWPSEARFDVVISRAFAELSDFVRQAGHLAAPTGFLLAMKGVHPFEEIARLPASHTVAEVLELAVPHLTAKRHLVLLTAQQRKAA